MGVGIVARKKSGSQKFAIQASEELSKKLDAIMKDTRPLMKRAVYEGAGIVADEVKARLEGNLIGSEYATGDLVNSLGISPIQVKENGDVNVRIGFSGYDRKGVPNVVKARVMESGSSKQEPRPFVRPAVNAVRKRVQERMKNVIEAGIEKL